MKMKYLLLFSGLLSLPLYLTGCGSLGCTEIGCADQLTVTLKGLASTHAAQLPLSINLAVDGKSLLDTSRHVLSVGVGLSLIGKVPLDLDLFGQAHLLTQCQCHLLNGQMFIGGATLGVRL